MGIMAPLLCHLSISPDTFVLSLLPHASMRPFPVPSQSFRASRGVRGALVLAQQRLRSQKMQHPNLRDPTPVSVGPPQARTGAHTELPGLLAGTFLMTDQAISRWGAAGWLTAQGEGTLGVLCAIWGFSGVPSVPVTWQPRLLLQSSWIGCCLTRLLMLLTQPRPRSGFKMLEMKPLSAPPWAPVLAICTPPHTFSTSANPPPSPFPCCAVGCDSSEYRCHCLEDRKEKQSQ